MKLHRRRKHSQRTANPRTVKFQINFAGQGGSPDLILELGDEYLWLEFESEAEVRQLMSQAAIIFKNYGDTP